MKKLLFILFLLILKYEKVFSQQIDIQKTRFVGCSSPCNGIVCNSVISTTDGGILFTGYTSCFDGGGDIPPSPPDTSTASSPANLIVGKLDNNLQLEWIKVYGGNRSDEGFSIAETSSGYAVLGRTFSNDRDVSGNHAVGIGDFWLLKLDFSGNLIWQKCYGSVYDELPATISATPDHGFIMFGVSNGMGGDVPNHYSPSQFDEDWFVVKVDSIGTIQWTKSIGGTGDESPTGNIIPVSNNYYFVSSSSSEDHDCNDNNWHNGVNTEGDYYIFKLDSAGNILWDSSYGGHQNEILNWATWDSRDSSLIMTGSTTSYDGQYMVHGYQGDADMWTVKVDKTGAIQWADCLGGNRQDIGYSVDTMNASYIVYGSINNGTVGQQDNSVFVIDVNGNQQYNKVFGGTDYDNPRSLAILNNVFIASGFTNSQSFTEGDNIGNENGVSSDAFFTYLEYHPLTTPSIVKDDGLSVYPNPFSSSFKITGKDNPCGAIRVSDILGRIVFTQDIGAFSPGIEIQTATWSNGVYIVEWRGQNGGIKTCRLVKD